jgi:hypothetical protein
LPANISIQVFNHFAGLAQAFPSLLAEQGSTEIFYTPEWFAALSRHGNTFQDSTQLIVAHDTETGAAICLPTIDGKDLDSLSNYYASLFGPIGLPENVTEASCQAIGQWLYAQPQRWPLLNFQPLDTMHPFFANMLPALQAAGYWADSYSCFGNWYLDVAGCSYADYLAKRPSTLRNTIDRNQRKTQKAGQVDIEIHHEPGPALEAAIDAFTTIYQQSWKPAETHPDFITELCRMGAQQGWLRLGILKSRGDAIAAQIWLVYAGKANIFKLAYIEGRNRFSAGTLLTAELMRHVIDVDRVHEVDYLTGDDAYKRDWMSHRRERKGIIAFHPRTLRGLFMGSKHSLGKLIRQIRQSKCSSTT